MRYLCGIGKIICVNIGHCGGVWISSEELCIDITC